MISLATIFFTSFMIALSGAMMPGPLLTATISESARRGSMAGPMLIFGHGILEFGLVVLLLMGLGPFLATDSVFIVIALAGAAILAWMGASMIRSLPTLSLSWEVNEKQAHRKSTNLVWAGILLSLANPYWSVWWVTIGLGYILFSMKSGFVGVLFFFAGHILADLAWYALVSAAVGRGRSFFSDSIYRGIIGFCASLLLLFSLFFTYSGAQRLFSGS